MSAAPAETRLRTLARSVTWRILGVLLTVVLTWWFFRDIRLGVELGIAYNAIRLVLHYFHDRLWARFAWGTPVAEASVAAVAVAPAPAAEARPQGGEAAWC